MEITHKAVRTLSLPSHGILIIDPEGLLDTANLKLLDSVVSAMIARDEPSPEETLASFHRIRSAKRVLKTRSGKTFTFEQARKASERILDVEEDGYALADKAVEDGEFPAPEDFDPQLADPADMKRRGITVARETIATGITAGDYRKPKAAKKSKKRTAPVKKAAAKETATAKRGKQRRGSRQFIGHAPDGRVALTFAKDAGEAHRRFAQKLAVPDVQVIPGNSYTFNKLRTNKMEWNEAEALAQ